MLDIMDGFERMTPNESLDLHDWGYDMVDGSTVYRREYVRDGVCFEVFAGNDGGLYSGGMGWYSELCETGRLLGAGWGGTPEDAVRAAYIDGYGWWKLNGDECCEDNVNDIAYSAYESFHGKWPETAEEYGELDTLLGLAADFVIKNGPSRGIVWEEYRNGH